ncbi:MAG: GNAT family N-acetyltransferase [Sporolactobacillus sp.]
MYISEHWDDQECTRFNRSQLVAYNTLSLPEHLRSSREQLDLLIHSEQGERIGGLNGEIFWKHLHINYLWIEERLRRHGYGRQLLEMAEKRATEKGCELILLDTFSFQAPEFYRKQGYQEFGRVIGHPEGYTRYFFEKRL